MNTIATTCLMSVLLLACGSGQSTPPTGTPATEVGARRVIQIFQHRHLRPRPLDAALCRVLFDRVLDALAAPRACRDVLGSEAEALEQELQRGDFSFPSRAAGHCGLPPIGTTRARALMLDALAKAHDPHSAYLTAEALARVRSEIHDAAPDAMRVRGRVVEHGDARIGLMVVPSFSLHADRSTSSDAAYVIQALSTQGVDVLVLDMRGNTGGVQSEAAKLVALFAGPGPVAQTVTANGALDILSAEADAVWTDPLVVVVDTMSASMAEVAVAALQDRGHALVVGQRTHGKGTGQTLVLLSSPHGGRDGAVRVTDRRFHRLDGRPLQQLGVTPDVVLPSSTAIASERDRIDALTFDAIPAIPAPPPLRGAPSTEAFPFSAALSWLRAEGLPSLAP